MRMRICRRPYRNHWRPQAVLNLNQEPRALLLKETWILISKRVICWHNWTINLTLESVNKKCLILKFFCQLCSFVEQKIRFRITIGVFSNKVCPIGQFRVVWATNDHFQGFATTLYLCSKKNEMSDSTLQSRFFQQNVQPNRATHTYLSSKRPFFKVVRPVPLLFTLQSRKNIIYRYTCKMHTSSVNNFGVQRVSVLLTHKIINFCENCNPSWQWSLPLIFLGYPCLCSLCMLQT